MAIIRAKNEADYTFKAGSYTGDKLRVVRFFGSEGVSELFRFSVDLASTDGAVDFEKVVGEPALLTIHGEKGKRYVHGLISLFEQVGKDGKWTLYRAEVVPAVWVLSRRMTCRIFQNQRVPDIIKKVLTDAGIASDQVRFSFKKTPNPRDYCVQYRESDLSFIARLMEEYGFFYFFEHAADKHVMVIGDDPVVHVAIADPSKVIYRAPGTAGVSDQEHVYAYQYQREIRTGAVRLRDFDFKKPRLNLEQEVKAKGDGKLEAYDYPGEYLAPDEGGDLAKARLEELQTTRQMGFGQSDCRRLIPGYRFTLERYDRSDFNREYLLTRVSHSGGQPQALGAEAAGGEEERAYQNQFDCIPSDVPFRPLRITPRPVVQGPQTAIVVGPKGEEIYTDEHGRVKVQFHWDRDGKQDEKSSCWVRVGQLWAGSGWGAMFIPRIGQEVIVEFLEGDPDQPIITGRVYNGDNKPPYALPGEKTKSTIKSNSSKGDGGSNEFRFEDAKGSEEIYLHGQKDWTIAIENDKNQKIGHDETTHIGNDRKENVDGNETVQIAKNRTNEVGADEKINIHGNRTRNVDGDEAIGIQKKRTKEVGSDEQITVGANRSTSVGKDDTLDVSGERSVSVEKNDTLTVGKSLLIDAGDKIVLKSGSASITLMKNGDILIDGNKISIQGSGSINIKGSGDVKIKGSKVLTN
ncbi:MAG: type VI secretion system tip protein VgrG [Nitrospirae bacterium]|nr:type VI secretion system tip protein VgrG [Nitrospirota bacterium]